MIRINLLPYRDARRQRLIQIIFGAWAATALLGAGIAWKVDVGFLDQIAALEDTKLKNDGAIKKLDKKLGKVKDLKARKETLQKRLQVIRNLDRQRMLPIHLLDEMTKTIPDQVWLSRMKTKKKVIILSGLAESSALVADFMRNISASPYYSDVDLSQVTQQGAKLKQFSLQFRFALPEGK